MSPSEQRLSQNLRRLIQERKITALHLSEIAGVSSSFISLILVGKRRIHLAKIDQLAEALGVTTVDLISEGRAADS